MKNILKKDYIFNLIIFTFCIFTSLLSTKNTNFDELLRRYHLDAPTPFSYEYKTEIVYSNCNDTQYGICEKGGSFELPEDVDNRAQIRLYFF
mgnify:CR=1 FL=1